jgi:nicotinate phosphoribosyltransferase
MTIINSLLDSDLYKFTMGQVVLHQFPGAYTTFKFKCRNENNLYKYVDEINDEIDHLCSLRFKKDELLYLHGIPFFKSDFVDYLSMLQLNRKQIECFVDANNELQIIARGPWRDVIWFEVPVLAIVQEVYTRNEFKEPSYKEGIKRLEEKIKLGNKYHKKLRMSIADFGTRRRFNFQWHKTVIDTLSKKLPTEMFSGTSNVLFAKEFGLKPIGTMAHEYLQAGQGIGHVPLVKSQSYMLDCWVKEYRGDLGIALSDVVGFNAFLNDFDKYFAKLYDGCRHDSGDPLIDHYQSLGIPANTKTAVFSDGLDFTLAFKLAERFRGRIQTSFGIGTNLTNDLGHTPLQIVMKMTECNGNPVAKISDSKGKGMCEDEDFLKYLKKVYNII